MSNPLPERAPTRRWTRCEIVALLVMRGAGASYAAIAAALGKPSYSIRDKLALVQDELAFVLASAIVNPQSDADLLVAAVIDEATKFQKPAPTARPHRRKPRTDLRSPSKIDALSEAERLAEHRLGLASRAAAAKSLGKKHQARIGIAGGHIPT